MTNKSRRQFIKNSMVTGGALMLPTTFLGAFSQAVKSGEKVKLGVIGVGSRGGYLIQIINSFAENNPFEIVAVCDNYEPNYQKALQLTAGKAKGFYDYRKLLELKGLDAVIVATPLYQHAHIVIDALESGIHVFCEKAMARTLADTKKMAEAHYRTGNILHVGHQRLFDPKYLKGMEMVHNKELGPVTQIRAYWHRNNDWRRKVPADKPELERQINWRLYKEYSCGVMTELASHQIQVANWAKKSVPVAVRGVGSINYWKDGREVYDNVALIYSYADGTQFIYDSMTSNRHYGLQEQIMGDKGTLELETNHFFKENPPPPPKPAGIIQLITDIEKGIFETVPIGGASWRPETAVKYQGEVLVEGNNTDGTPEQLKAFAASVLTGNPIPGLFEHGYHASVWTLLGQQAMDTGETVTLPGFMEI
ncbi:MAG: Gfo/Idh/MocA family oxidoreductase [Marinilabiliaceae bacterium]|nr:Gfo/Idh/MocA family oxidoreductase [Marinilabiliaceae bacterium]